MKLFISVLIVAVVATNANGCLLKKKCLLKECCQTLTPLLGGQAPYGASLAGGYGLPYGLNAYAGLNPYGLAGGALPCLNPLAGAGLPALNPLAGLGLPLAGGLYGGGCGCGCGCSPIAECLCEKLKPCLLKKALFKCY